VPARTLSEAPLRVAEELRGAELASPTRRALALAFDLALIAIPNLLTVALVAWLSLRVTDPAAFRALPVVFEHRGGQPAAPEALAAIAPLLVRTKAEGAPPELEEAVHEHDRARAAALLRPYSFDFLVSIAESEDERPLAPGMIRVRVANFIPRVGRALASYGVMALYFGLLTAGFRGQTLGKRLLGIRVVRLDGHRISLVESLERFVGYLHIPGTLGISILGLWRDPNRRMAHDRVAHTVVVRVPPRRREPVATKQADTPKEAPAPVASPPAAAAAAMPEKATPGSPDLHPDRSPDRRPDGAPRIDD
jgi:hypothetical protein